MGAYTLLFLGMRRLDRNVGRLRWLFLLTLLTLGAGIASPVFADNRIRATVFHVAATTALLGAGLGMLSGRRLDPLPSRIPLGLTLLACGTVYALQLSLLLSGTGSVAVLALGLSVTMMMNFAIAALVVSFVRERREEVHRRVSVTDGLTGVLNRQGFMTHVPESIAAGAALAILDLDHFKAINDRFGHAGGDHALTVFARGVERHLGRGEILARIGGEEFVVYFPVTTHDRAARVAEEMRDATQACVIPWQGDRIGISVSVGLAFTDRLSDRATLLARADAALYRAKATGRNRVAVASPDERPRHSRPGRLPAHHLAGATPDTRAAVQRS